MQVILLKDVPKIGRAHEKHTVSDGYARNYLIPRGLAAVATKAAEARTELARSIHDEKARLETEATVAAIEALDGSTITIVEKANDQGHLFHGIHEPLVAERATPTGVPALDPKLFKGDFPIKTTGTHTVCVEHGGKSATLTVVVESQ